MSDDATPDDTAPEDRPPEDRPPEDRRHGLSDEAVMDGIAHLQVAAREMVEALKLFGEAAERAVADPDGAGAVVRRMADVGRSFVEEMTGAMSEPSRKRHHHDDSSSTGTGESPDDGIEQIVVE